MAKVYNFVGKFGSAGSGDGQFNTISGIDVDANYIYVVDQGNSRIQIFNKTTFAFVGKFGSAGAGDGQFNTPIDLTVDASQIYVTDRFNSRIQIFNKATYAFVSKFSVADYGNALEGITVDDTYIYTSSHTGVGGVDLAISIYEKVSPYLFIAYINNNTIGLLTNNTSNVYLASDTYEPGIHIYSKATKLEIGTIDLGSNCYAVAIDTNYVYIIRKDVHRIDVHDISTLAFVEFFGSLGTGDGQFNNPKDIAVYNDKFYVADPSNNRIQIFDFTYQTAPAAPSGLTAACGANRTIELNWTDNS